MKFLGRHYIAELYDCEPSILNDVEQIEQSMRKAALAAKATIVDAVFHRFSPHGVSGVVVISESHLSIHTWPEFGYAAVDTFTCGDECEPEQAINVLATALFAKRRDVRRIDRGASSRVLGHDKDSVSFVHKPVPAVSDRS